MKTKIFKTIGTLAIAASPIISVISCGKAKEKDKNEPPFPMQLGKATYLRTGKWVSLGEIDYEYEFLDFHHTPNGYKNKRSGSFEYFGEIGDMTVGIARDKAVEYLNNVEWEKYVDRHGRYFKKIKGKPPWLSAFHVGYYITKDTHPYPKNFKIKFY